MTRTAITRCVVLVTIGIVAAWFAPTVNGFEIGLVSDGPPKENSKAAYEWAKGEFDARVIPPPKSRTDLTSFGVIWWDESNGPEIPAVFLEDATIKAFLDYVNDGGGLLLSNLAFHYVSEMGVESGSPRYFGGNPASPLDWTDFQIAKGKDGHPIFKNMPIKDGLIQYDIQGWTDGSDFCVGPNGPNDGTVLAQVPDGHPQCNPLVEYSVGNGTIVAIGWVWSSWVVNEKLEKTHAPLHANILNYLASKSAFAAVSPNGKTATAWGALKRR